MNSYERKSSCISLGVLLLSVGFFLSGVPALGEEGAKERTVDQVSEAIAKTWSASNDLNTLLELASLAPRAGEYSLGEISRKQALDGARRAATKLERELKALQGVRHAATPEQRRTINGLTYIAEARRRAFEEVLAAFIFGIVESKCTSLWSCIGFEFDCVVNGGTYNCEVEHWSGACEQASCSEDID